MRSRPSVAFFAARRDREHSHRVAFAGLLSSCTNSAPQPRRLARQPGVDLKRIAVLGVSRGSEAAQLLGAYYPDLVHAVIASVPSNVALCSYPGCTGPAWTWHGQVLPYTKELDDPAPTDNPAAVIPDQRIPGPVFLDCGEAD